MEATKISRFGKAIICLMFIVTFEIISSTTANAQIYYKAFELSSINNDKAGLTDIKVTAYSDGDLYINANLFVWISGEINIKITFYDSNGYELFNIYKTYEEYVGTYSIENTKYYSDVRYKYLYINPQYIKILIY